MNNKLEKISREYAVSMVPTAFRLSGDRGLNQSSGRYAAGNNAAVFYPSLTPGCSIVERFSGLGHYYALIRRR